MMDADEREIFQYLRKDREVFVAAATISRQAGGKHRFRQDSDWAKAALLRMAERGIVEIDATGAYRLKPMPKRSVAEKATSWVSPQIAEILRKSGKKFDVLIPDDLDEETYYNSL
jgi:hypothetical protein